MTTSLSKDALVFPVFGWVLMPEWLYQDYVSENQLKRDRIQQLELDVKDKANRLTEIEGNSDRQKATIQQLQDQVNLLEESDHTNNEVIDHLNGELFNFRTKLLDAQKELDTIKETYRKTLAANAELELKLGDAIASLSKSEQQYNELTVQICLERTANKIAIDNARRDVLVALDHLGIKQAN